MLNLKFLKGGKKKKKTQMQSKLESIKTKEVLIKCLFTHSVQGLLCQQPWQLQWSLE